MEMYKYTSEVSVKEDIISLSRYFRNQLNKLNEVSGDDKYSIDKIARNLEISGDMLQKKLNGSKPLSREWLIAICAAFGLGGCETNKLLNFAGYSQLDWNVPLECILLCYINEKKNTGKAHSLKEINDYLTDNGCERICVKFRRNQSTESNSENQKSEQYEVKKSVITDTELSESDYYNNGGYNSINKVFAEAKLIKDGEIKYTLRISSDGKYISVKENDKEATYRTIADTGALACYFPELLVLAKNEQRKVEYLLFDSKNFPCNRRFAMKIENNDLHIFCETFGQEPFTYGEYYLLEYIDGQVRFSISNQSMFMKEYLSEEEYNYHYGYLPVMDRTTYTSWNSIYDKKKSAESEYEKKMWGERVQEYRDLSYQMCEQMKKIKNGYDLCDVRDIYEMDNEYDVIKFFNIEKEFKCKYDEESQQIVSACKKACVLYNNEKYNITFDELKRAYELGLVDIGQLCCIKKKYKSINDGLKNIIESIEKWENYDYSYLYEQTENAKQEQI